jgi:hypothetical protein
LGKGIKTRTVEKKVEGEQGRQRYQDGDETVKKLKKK